jgi:hypothetical protein
MAVLNYPTVLTVAITNSTDTKHNLNSNLLQLSLNTLTHSTNTTAQLVQAVLA